MGVRGVPHSVAGVGVRVLVEKERTASETVTCKVNSVPTATVKDQAHSFVAGLLRSRDLYAPFKRAGSSLLRRHRS